MYGAPQPQVMMAPQPQVMHQRGRGFRR